MRGCPDASTGYHVVFLRGMVAGLLHIAKFPRGAAFDCSQDVYHIPKAGTPLGSYTFTTGVGDK